MARPFILELQNRLARIRRNCGGHFFFRAVRKEGPPRASPESWARGRPGKQQTPRPEHLASRRGRGQGGAKGAGGCGLG
eukprot:7876512-Pyramimonas_sp.AAC.1